MADYRQIHTRIWCDEWFLELPADAKLLFIYLFSNKRTCLAGIYDIPLKLIAFETELTQDRILELFREFARDGKAFYEDGYVWVPTMPIHNTNNLASPKVQANIRHTAEALPDMPFRARWVEYWNHTIAPRYGIDTISIPYLQNKTDHDHNNTDQESGADAPPPNGGQAVNGENTQDGGKEREPSIPTTFQEWQALIKTPPKSSNRTAVLMRMYKHLYPGLDPPSYSYVGSTSKKIGGAGRLADWMWQIHPHPPTGDLMAYIIKANQAQKARSNGRGKKDHQAEYIDEGDNPLGITGLHDDEPVPEAA